MIDHKDCMIEGVEYIGHHNCQEMIEGDLTGIHNSTRCECPMCKWADEAEARDAQEKPKQLPFQGMNYGDLTALRKIMLEVFESQGVYPILLSQRESLCNEICKRIIDAAVPTCPPVVSDAWARQIGKDAPEGDSDANTAI